MKSALWCVATMTALWCLVGCAQPVQRVAVPGPENQNAYAPVPQPKPLPPEAMGGAPQPMPVQPMPGQAMPGQAGVSGGGGQPMPGGGGPQAGLAPSRVPLPSEENYVKAYAIRRSPRMMVFVNRTIHGDALPKDNLNELIRIETKQTASGGLNVSSERGVSANSNSNSASAGYAGSSVGNSTSTIGATNRDSFSSTGPAEYSRSTSVKVAPGETDAIGATRTDYEMIELSMIDYLDAGGRVQIRDSAMAREKLDREKVLRIENGDPAAVRLLATELQTDVLIQVNAVPTTQSQWGGKAVRLLCKAVGTTDARNLGSAFVDMPLPMTKTNINVFTRYLADKLMEGMTTRWGGNPEWDPIEVRIYKVASIDDSLKIRKYLLGLKGVTSVVSSGATGSSSTSYAVLRVAYQGAPEDMYGDLKDALGRSQGLKAVDLQNNTINLEVTGQMDLVTTTSKTETKTTVETKTTETKTVDPIRPAPPPPSW